MEKALLSDNSKILLPIDFSDYSEKAGIVAFELAVRFNAELMIIHVSSSTSFAAFPFSDTYAHDTELDKITDDIEENAENEIHDFILKLQNKNHEFGNEVVINYQLTKGVAENEILKFSEEYKPTLIIMGTRGENRKNIDLIGSVTAEVAEKTKFPLMAIPEDFNYQGIDNIRNIIYLANFEETDFLALKKLEDLVKLLNVKIFFVHAGKHKEREWDLLKLKSLKSYIKEHVPNADITCDLIETEDFWADLENYVQNNKIDIISFTTHRRRLVARLLYPDIERKMLFQTTTPLLIFHA